MPTLGLWFPTLPANYAPLCRAWQRHYESRGVAQIRAGFLAAKKARRGLAVPA